MQFTSSEGQLSRIRLVERAGPLVLLTKKGRHLDGLCLSKSYFDLSRCSPIRPEPLLPDQDIPFFLVAANKGPPELFAGDGSGEAARQWIAH